MKKALLIGINYIGTPNQLNGCINDVQNLKDLIVPVDTEIKMLTDTVGNSADNLPTAANILSGLNWLCDVNPGDKILFQYSGHGSYTVDTSGDESDNRDELIVPLDYSTAGMISDDTLRQILSKLPEGVQLFVVMDCCHSGTNLDLKYSYQRNSEGKVVQKTYKYSELPAEIVCVAGCKDSQTSADTVEPDVLTGKWEAQGALSYAIGAVYSKYKSSNKLLTWRRLLCEIYDTISAYEQKPQLASNKKLNIDDKVFI